MKLLYLIFNFEIEDYRIIEIALLGWESHMQCPKYKQIFISSQQNYPSMLFCITQGLNKLHCYFINLQTSVLLWTWNSQGLQVLVKPYLGQVENN